MSPVKFLPGLLLALAACRTQAPVHFSSSPPGASVLINGQDTGFVTPCLIELEDAPVRRVQFQLRGYRTEARVLRDEKRSELVTWRESTHSYKTWNFPLWLGAEDFFIPRKSLSGESPSRLYVRLRRKVRR